MMNSIAMPNPVVFESTESVIEILWDIALAVFVIRLAFIYVALTAVVVVLFGWATSGLLPLSVHLPDALAKAIAACSPSVSAASAERTLTIVALVLPAVAIPALCARLVNGYYRIPRVASYRLAIGLMSLVYVVLGSLLASLVLPAHMRHGAHCGHSHVPSSNSSYSSSSLYNIHVALGGLFVASVALMPCLSMWLMEGRRSPSTLSELPSQVSEKHASFATVSHAAYQPLDNLSEKQADAGEESKKTSPRTKRSTPRRQAD
ncbi:hypothetical protein CMQ_364 [Grosmannia clavigera kw1407]|uniref:Uncharacterized protein n=1 Tax=Grosmannia clavigera (strain kw1407 / UAMH 11150) TaxID=655863 RepID=F0XF23_GROCL|nr:uncharacterized protein CMQ_364 [Grosmannia clavigera kw1407]EFX03436.1 hypothetical protein CMQ_364 [Grosmannia clavigera kw1407]